MENGLGGLPAHQDGGTPFVDDGLGGFLEVIAELIGPGLSRTVASRCFFFGRAGER